MTESRESIALPLILVALLVVAIIALTTEFLEQQQAIDDLIEVQGD